MTFLVIQVVNFKQLHASLFSDYAYLALKI